MPVLACHCGQVRVELGRRPDYIHECNCSLCSKSGARWAYFDPADVSVAGSTHGYCREDKGEPGAEVHFCPNCGSTTHFTLTPGIVAKFGDTMVGVNMRLADDKDLAGIELRFPDGRNWRGEDAFGYVREARLL